MKPSDYEGFRAITTFGGARPRYVRSGSVVWGVSYAPVVKWIHGSKQKGQPMWLPFPKLCDANL